MKINKDNYEIYFLDYSEGNLSEEQVVALLDFVALHPNLKAELDDFEQIMLDEKAFVYPGKALLKKTEDPTCAICSDDFIAYHEGDLNAEERKEVEGFIANNPSAKIEFEQLAKMYLIPEEGIIFNSKNQLKKREEKYTAEDYIAYHEGDLTSHESRELLIYIEAHPEAKKRFDSFVGLRLKADRSIVFADKSSLKKKETKVIAMYWRYVAVAASLLLMVSLYWLNSNDRPADVLVQDQPSIEVNDTVDAHPPSNEKEFNEIDQKKPFQLAEDNNELLESETQEVTPSANPSHTTPKMNNAAAGKDNRMALNPSVKPATGLESIDGQQINPPVVPRIMNTVHLQSIDEIAHIKLYPESLQATDSAPMNNTLPINNMAKTKSVDKIRDQQPLTLLAFAEKKATKVLTGKDKDKLRVFDVMKRVGEKTRLYDLKEKEDNKFSLKIASIELVGKRKKIQL